MPDTVFQALHKAAIHYGWNKEVCEDSTRQKLTYKDLYRAALVLGHHITGFTKKGEDIGLLLPNANGALIAFFALSAYGRIATWLNPMAGASLVHDCACSAGVKTILTSRKFIQIAELESFIDTLSTEHQIIYLEDLRKKITWFDKLHAIVPRYQKNAAVNEPATILFTSGSEGMPKGVVLSHGNLLSNIAQIRTRLIFNENDVVFNCLPMFHSFGLTAGSLLPVLSGAKTFLYPSPLHYQIVPQLLQETKATIFFSTNTFLNGYARKATKENFSGLRFIVAGAEPLRDTTRALYHAQFDQDILEGYGVTETSPVIAVNYPNHNKVGTVGKIFPDIEYRLEPVEGIKEGGKLQVRGANIMLGYYYLNDPQKLVAPPDGWHDTGDIVKVDSEDYISIIGRARRFAKIGGEMVSLSRVENLALAASPEAAHASMAIADEKRGQQILLITTDAEMTRDKLITQAQKLDYPELLIPKKIHHVANLPLLASGKVNYGALRDMFDK